MRIRRGPDVLEFIAMLEAPRDGLVVHDGVQQSGTWWLSFTEIRADTARLGEQCPDLSLEARATVHLETTGVLLEGTGDLRFDSWTVLGWEAEIVSNSAAYSDFTGTLRFDTGGDDFDDVRWSQGFYNGESDGGVTELGFSNQ